MSIKKGYKLVYKRVSGKLLSQHLSEEHRSRAKTYRPGVWTVPSKGCGPLCVFDELKLARRFRLSQVPITRQPRVIIRRCEYVPSNSTAIWLSAARGNPMTRWELRMLPTGTVLADAVKLIPMRGEPGYGKT